MAEDIQKGNVTVTGDDPLVDGMKISVRMRLDFVVTDADLFLTAAQRAYRDLNPDADDDWAARMVTCAADAIFTVLEQARVLGDLTDEHLDAFQSEGLTRGGLRAQVVFNDPHPLPNSHCAFGDPPDVFALPEGTTR